MYQNIHISSFDLSVLLLQIYVNTKRIAHICGDVCRNMFTPAVVVKVKFGTHLTGRAWFTNL